MSARAYLMPPLGLIGFGMGSDQVHPRAGLVPTAMVLPILAALMLGEVEPSLCHLQ